MPEDPRRPGAPERPADREDGDGRHDEARHEPVEPGEVRDDAPPEVREAEREE